MANCDSSGNRELEQTAAMLSPCVYFECGRLRDIVNADFGRRVTAERCMCKRMIVVISEKFKLLLQVGRIPELSLVKKLAAIGSDESLYEGMRPTCR